MSVGTLTTAAMSLQESRTNQGHLRSPFPPWITQGNICWASLSDQTSNDPLSVHSDRSSQMHASCTQRL